MASAPTRPPTLPLRSTNGRPAELSRVLRAYLSLQSYSHDAQPRRRACVCSNGYIQYRDPSNQRTALVRTLPSRSPSIRSARVATCVHQGLLVTQRTKWRMLGLWAPHPAIAQPQREVDTARHLAAVLHHAAHGAQHQVWGGPGEGGHRSLILVHMCSKHVSVSRPQATWKHHHAALQTRAQKAA